jgi:hypothetical protein
VSSAVNQTLKLDRYSTLLPLGSRVFSFQQTRQGNPKPFERVRNRGFEAFAQRSLLISHIARCHPVRGKIASPIPGQRIELARCVASAIVKIMREKRSRREADVYKAKIGRDAIIDIHVRRYSSKPYYFHPKSTGVSGKRVQGRTHISSGGPSKIRRQTDVSINVSISTPSAAFQVPHHTIPYHTILYHTIPYHTKVTTADFAPLYLPLSHKKRKVRHSKEKRESTRAGVPNPSTLRPGSRFVNSHQHPGSGDLVLCSELSRLPIPDPGSWFARAETSATESLFAGLI